ncbi:MAG: TonB-dependent receptor plug domain-containing protein [Sulfuricurvum sp.]|nr:TonB-dependent receptor plug domain-containing protein [Sulfuricurvum sp.]
MFNKISKIKEYSCSTLCCLLFFSSILIADDQTSIDATSIEFEELLKTEYIPASHIANQISNAASAVSIVTAEDIKDYGYRTLGEILGSMRGVQTFEDYTYTYLAGRAYSSPGEYAGRIAVLIDGYRADDSMFGQAYLGNDGILDVSLIDRVEYIPGGSSAGYSNGALLGVINIITKKGSDKDGLQVAYGHGNYDSRSRRISFGKMFDNGADILFSASDYDSLGRDYTYDVGGVQTVQANQHGEENKRLLFKGSYNNIILMAAWAKRKIDLPTYSYGAVLSDIPVINSDENGFTRLVIDSDLARDLKLSTSIWYGFYKFGFKDPVSLSQMNSLMDMQSVARWYGGDLKFVGTWFKDHVISLGSEYRYDFEWKYSHIFSDITSGDVWSSSSKLYTPRKTYSIYGYDEYYVTPTLGLNYGMRYETSNNGYHALSPQAAVIWNPRRSTQLKLSTGMTNRQVTASEGANIIPERARTTELVIEENVDRHTKWLASVYRYRIGNRISWGKTSDVIAHGVEVEFEKHWENSTRFRTSYAYQNAYEVDNSLPLINTPHHIAKGNLSVPIIDERLRSGIEVQYLGKRPLYTDTRNEFAPSHTLTNLTFLSHEWISNTDLTFKIRNVFNKQYGDVVSLQANGDLLYPQNGRTFWIELEYNFR